MRLRILICRLRNIMMWGILRNSLKELGCNSDGKSVDLLQYCPIYLVIY
jgi:hypothetical protein